MTNNAKQYIEQQNELIKSLRERIDNIGEDAEDAVSKEREVNCEPSSFLSFHIIKATD